MAALVIVYSKDRGLYDIILIQVATQSEPPHLFLATGRADTRPALRDAGRYGSFDDRFGYRFEKKKDKQARLPISS